MLCCTRLAVVPRKISARKRWPCVLIATRSQPFCSDPLDDFLDGIAIGEFGFGGDARGLKLGADFFQIGGVFGDFAG